MVPVPTVEPLTAENVLWANTVLAAGSAIGFVVYTGAETRAVMNTGYPKTKVGLLDLEVNRLAKVHIQLCLWDGSTLRWQFPYPYRFCARLPLLCRPYSSLLIASAVCGMYTS